MERERRVDRSIAQVSRCRCWSWERLRCWVPNQFRKLMAARTLPQSPLGERTDEVGVPRWQFGHGPCDPVGEEGEILIAWRQDAGGDE